MKTSKLPITFAPLLVLTGFVCAASLDPNNPTGITGLILIDTLGHLGRVADPVRLHELSSVPADAPPHDLAIAPNHKTMYVPIYGDDVIHLQQDRLVKHFTRASEVKRSPISKLQR